MALHALQQRGLLAEDVAARRGEDLDLQPPAAAQRVVAEDALLAQALDLGLQHLLLGAVLVADEDPALLRAGHEHPEHHPLQDEMGLLGQDLTVLERPGLGLVGVADRVLRLGLLAGDDLPLLAGREAGAAHAPQARVLQRGDDRLRAQVAGERAAQEPVALGPGLVGVVRAALVVATQRLGLLVLARAGGGDGGVDLGERPAGARRPPRPARCRSAPGTRPRRSRSRRRRRTSPSSRGSARRSRAAST